MNRFQFSHLIIGTPVATKSHLLLHLFTSDENETVQNCFIFPNVLRFHNNGLH